uniref:Uncharacterized protein n=1 Tax=Arundo donax TaxID=35708 RepID=A0A0A9F218_ARUDO
MRLQCFSRGYALHQSTHNGFRVCTRNSPICSQHIKASVALV